MQEPMECEESSVWSCPQCTLVNSDSDLECNACGSTRIAAAAWKKPATSSKQPKAHSNGTHCQQNGDHGTKSANGAKTKSKADTKSDRSAKADNWQCRRCTLLNPVTLKSCSVCEAPRLCNIPTDLPRDIDDQGHRSPPAESNGLSSPKPGTRSDDYQTDGAAVSEKAPALPPKQKTREKAGTSTDPIAVEDQPEWRCPHCTFPCNAGWVTKCDSCGHPKKGGSTKPPTSPIQMGKDSVKYFHKTPAADPQPGPSATNAGGRGSSQCTWSCGQCTLENPSTVALCTMCGAGRPGSGSDTWVCSQCTLVNGARFSSCRVCKSPRAKKSGKTGSKSDSRLSPGSWRCSCCTFLNKREEKCRVCGAFKDGTSPNQRLRPLTPLHCSPAPQTTSSTSDPVTPPTPGGMYREESLLMDDIQKVVEQDAIERRGIILAFCKQVGNFITTYSANKIKDFLFLCTEGLCLKLLLKFIVFTVITSRDAAICSRHLVVLEPICFWFKLVSCSFYIACNSTIGNNVTMMPVLNGWIVHLLSCLAKP